MRQNENAWLVISENVSSDSRPRLRNARGIVAWKAFAGRVGVSEGECQVKIRRHPMKRSTKLKRPWRWLDSEMVDECHLH